jgi:hypothetical protein
MGFKKENIIFANPEKANLDELINNDSEFKIEINEEVKKNDDDIQAEAINEHLSINSEPININPLPAERAEEEEANNNVTLDPFVDDTVNLEFLFKQLNNVGNVIIIEEDDEIPEEIIIESEGNGNGLEVKGEHEEIKVEQVKDNDVKLEQNPNDSEALKISNNVSEDKGKKQSEPNVERGGSKHSTVKHNQLIDESNKDKEESKKKVTEPIVIKVVEPVVKMKDKKIVVNLEDLEKEYSKKEQHLFGEINYENKEEMKLLNQEIELMHPRIIRNGMVMKYPVCTEMGNFGCSNTKVNENLKELGLGMIVILRSSKFSFGVSF